MNKRLTIIIVLIITTIVSLTACGSSDSSEMMTTTEQIPLGNETTVSANIQVSVGDFNLESTSSDLFDAKVDYNLDILQPTFSYNSGQLNVSQSDPGSVANPNSEWAVKLTESVPLDLKISAGVGDLSLSLADLNLQSFELEAGVGNIDLDLNGDWGRNLNTTIKNGTGNVEIFVPAEMGVEIKFEESLVKSFDAEGFNQQGDLYTNASFDSAEYVLSIEIESGVGEVKIIEQN